MSEVLRVWNHKLSEESVQRLEKALKQNNEERDKNEG